MRAYSADLACLAKVVAFSNACSLYLLRQGCSPTGPRQFAPHRWWQAGPCRVRAKIVQRFLGEARCGYIARF